MKRWICAFLTLVLLFGLASCANSERDWQGQYDLGMRYLDDGDYEMAILAFSAAIEIDSSRPEAYMGRAEAYIAIGEPEKALKDYKRARRAAQDSDEDYEDLIEDLEQVIEELENPTENAGTDVTGGKRLIQVVLTEENGNLTRYDLEHNDRGLLSTVRYESPYGSGTENYYYDDQNRLTDVWNDFAIAAGTPKIRYYYDENGCLTKITGIGEGGGTGGVYENDAQGRPVRYTQELDFATIVTEYTYGDDPLVVYATEYYDITDGDSTVTQIEYTYDDQGHLLSERRYGNASGTGEYSYVYTYSREYKPFVTETQGNEIPYKYTLEDKQGHSIWTLYISEPDAIETDGDGYVTRIHGAQGQYDFIYDEASRENSEAPAVEQTQPPTQSDSLAYDIAVVDKSAHREDGTLAWEYFYEQVTVKGRGEVATKINAAIEADMEDFFAAMSEEDMEAYFNDYLKDSGGNLIYTREAAVTECTDRIFSIRFGTSWFMGGVFTADATGLSFDARTGEPLYLPELFGMEENDFLSLLKTTVWTYLVNEMGSDLWEDTQDMIYGYALSDFNYYIQSGELIIVFPTYSISYGAVGCITVPTGFYY